MVKKKLAGDQGVGAAREACFGAPCPAHCMQHPKPACLPFQSSPPASAPDNT